MIYGGKFPAPAEKGIMFYSDNVHWLDAAVNKILALSNAFSKIEFMVEERLLPTIYKVVSVDNLNLNNNYRIFLST
jgi:hypothetical protein